MKLRGLVTVLALAILAAACASSESIELDLSADPVPLPDQQLSQLAGADFPGVIVGLRGQAVVVNLWASWCPPCRAEAPLLQEASEAFAGQATFIGVASPDSGDSQGFIDQYGITYPNVSDTSGDISRLLSMTALPTTYFFDSEGELRARITGGVSEQQLAALIEESLP